MSNKEKWERLEKFFNNDASILCQFMYIGTAKVDDEKVLHLYKHIDTRRYINLDKEGECYKFDFMKRDNEYVPVSKEEAKRHVFSLCLTTV